MGRRRVARGVQCGPGRGVCQGCVVFCHCLGPAALAGQEVAPGFQRIGEVRGARGRGGEIGGGGGQVVVIKFELAAAPRASGARAGGAG